MSLKRREKKCTKYNNKEKSKKRTRRRSRCSRAGDNAYYYSTDYSRSTPTQ